ncbi:MAG TPA: tetratricopeptide repeat protein [Planktothrix sp.]|jgi:tetratricopeptide (TPR) repeat protein
MAQPALLPPAQIWSSTTTTSSFGPGAVSVQNATNTLLNPTNAATVLSPGEIGASTMPGSAATPVLLQPVLNVAPPGTATPGKLVITAGSFGHDTNLNKAYTEACQQQDAHFNEPFFYFRKAKLQIEMKNYSKAEQELKYLIVDDPMNSDYYIARAYCYHKMKKETAALDDLNSAKSRNPTLPQDIEFGD